MRAPEFWKKRGVLAWLLRPLSHVYVLPGRWRWQLARPWVAPVPVICVGNLVAGGAGKTPIALSLAEHLQARGRTPHFLTRGYGGTIRRRRQVDPARHNAAQVGDEPLLLAAVAPTWVARNRVKGAEAAIAAGADVIVMDDGFQNPSLAKHLSIVVIDGGYGFGNGWPMPAGPLRETLDEGLDRADIAVVVGDVAVELDLPFMLTTLQGYLVPVDRLPAGRRVVAFAGIGRPDKFFDTLSQMGCDLVSRHPFGDHHRYREQDIQVLADEAEKAGALLVTTAKDAVRLPDKFRDLVTVVRVAVEWSDPAALADLLDQVLDDG